ncbi:MAG TPA: hypothetical protein VGE74_27695 [Gemmata sp.]
MPAKYLNTKPDCYNPLAETNRDTTTNGYPDQSIAGASPAESMSAAQHAIAVAFGYSPATAPDTLLRVGSGARHDESVPSQAHLDTVAAFSTESSV